MEFARESVPPDFLDDNPPEAEWEPTAGEVHTKAVRHALNLLIACEEVTSDFLSIKSKKAIERKEFEAQQAIPNEASFDEALLFIVGKHCTRNERLRRFTEFLQAHRQESRSGTSVRGLIKIFRKDGFTFDEIYHYQSTFLCYWKTRQSDVKARNGKLGGRPKKN